jgi:hypothetical protein
VRFSTDVRPVTLLDSRCGFIAVADCVSVGREEQSRVHAQTTVPDFELKNKDVDAFFGDGNT